MRQLIDESRRQLLKSVALAVALIPIARVGLAADLPLVTSDDPTAKALKYVADASNRCQAGQQVRQLFVLPRHRRVGPGRLPIVPRQGGKSRRVVRVLDRQDMKA